MPSTFVRKCLSTLIRFRSSNSTPTFSAPRPSENGRRPTDTNTLSASIFSSSPPFVAVAVARFDRNLSWGCDGAEAFEGRDLVCFHESAHAASESFHNLVFALLHFRKIDVDAIDHDPVLLGFLFREHEMIARSQERLAR